MSGIRKGLLLGTIQIALVLSLGGKLLYDRKTRPRVWVLSGMFDPELPIRGRYLVQRLQLPTEGFTYTSQPGANEWWTNRQWAYLEVRNNQLIGKQQGSGPGEWIHLHKNKDSTIVAFSEEPVLVFIPEHTKIASLKPDQEMWVEVTVPAKGPPRPIRIGIKRDGVLTPLKFE